MRSTGNQSFKRPMQIVSGIYLFILLILFPLFFYDHYWNMAFFKWVFYMFSTLTFVAVWIVTGIIVYIRKCALHIKEDKKAKEKFYLCPEYYVIGYGIICVLSFAMCENKSAAWMGTDSWYMGMIAQSLFVITFLVMAYFGVSEKLFLRFFQGGAAIIFIIAILQRYGVNVFYLYWDMPDEVKRDYLSTIGNRGWFAGYTSTVFPLVFYLYSVASKLKDRIITSIFLLITCSCLLIMNTDSIYPALLVVLWVLVIISVGSRDKFTRLFEINAVWWLSAVLMAVWRLLCTSDQIRELRGISVYTQNLYIAGGMLILSVLALTANYLYCKKKEEMSLSLDSVKKIRLILSILPVAVIVLYVIIATLNTLGVLHINKSIFIFDSDFGDGRGFIWGFSLKMYSELDIKSKLFGVGHDCFAYKAYSNSEYATVLSSVFGDSTLANAHNEWLNALICQGVLGLFFYLGTFVTVFYQGLKCMKNVKGSNLIPGIGLCALGYIVNNFFGYQQASAASVIFVAMGVATYLRREIRGGDYYA